MALSNLSGNPSKQTLLPPLYDSIRKRWVDNTPEERIRQTLLSQMTGQLGYPASLIAVEKELSAFPHVRQATAKTLPKRRADIIVFNKASNGSLKPLLMIECKATPLTPKFARQVIGYNAFVAAPFLALANESQILTGFFDPQAGIYRFEEGLPPFDALANKI